MKKLLLLALCLFLAATAFAQQKATKTITNADVEQFRQKRIQAEEDYRKNYKQLGMPSPEELEKRNQESQDWREEFSRKQAQERAQQGGDIAYRANVLRSQIANNAAQINYLRSVIARIPANKNVIEVSELNQYIFPGTSYNYGYGYPVRIGIGRRGGYNYPNRNYQQIPQQVTPNPAVAGALAAQNLSAAYNLDPNYLNQRPVSVYGRGGWRRVERRQSYYSPGYIYPYPVANYNRMQRDELVARLRLLEQERAGLLAQWGALEDEARNAGVRIN